MTKMYDSLRIIHWGKIMKLPSSSSNNDVFVTKWADSNVP